MTVCLLEVDRASDPRAELAHLISAISEEPPNFACWEMGVEEAVWRAVQGGDNFYHVDEKQIARLRELSAQIGGWVHWDDDGGGVRFVPLDEWLAIYADAGTDGAP